MSMVVVTRSAGTRGLGYVPPTVPHPYPPAQARIDRAVGASRGWNQMQLRGVQGGGLGAMDMGLVKSVAPWALAGLAIGGLGVFLVVRKKRRRR